MDRKLKRLVLDLEDILDSNIDRASKEDIERALIILKNIEIYENY